jgi:hypothetical protein
MATSMAPRPPPGRPNGQGGRTMAPPAPKDGAFEPPECASRHRHRQLARVPPTACLPACLPRHDSACLTSRVCLAGSGPPPTIDDADYEAFEGLFESARTRRATQQRATTTDLGGGENPTTTMQERVYGAVLSPRVIRTGLDTWTRAVSLAETGPGSGGRRARLDSAARHRDSHTRDRSIAPRLTLVWLSRGVCVVPGTLRTGSVQVWRECRATAALRPSIAASCSRAREP